MKKILITLVVGMSVMLTSCFKELDKVLDDKTYVEFQQAIVRTVAVGKTYPLIAVANGLGVVSTPRINLVGRQRATDTQVKYTIDQNESTAKEGVHYKINDGGTIIIKANESFGTANFEILRAPVVTGDAGKTFTVVLMLTDGSDFKASENYKRIGYRITL
ncbi:MAG: hypothetical protein U5N85_10170 [Arcicella sp.]|nr:hypothetical protein [Arcicella sp.]